MHYRFAKPEASQRKGRQIIATLQAAGRVGNAAALAQSRRHECQARGLNFSFSIKATSPLSRGPRNTGPSSGSFHRPHCGVKGKLSRDNGADYGMASGWEAQRAPTDEERERQRMLGAQPWFFPFMPSQGPSARVLRNCSWGVFLRSREWGDKRPS